MFINLEKSQNVNIIYSLTSGSFLQFISIFFFFFCISVDSNKLKKTKILFDVKGIPQGIGIDLYRISKCSLETFLNLAVLCDWSLIYFYSQRWKVLPYSTTISLLCRLLYTAIALVDTLSLSSPKKTFAINAVSAREC